MDDEVLEIRKAYPVVKQFLSERSIRTIERLGLYEGVPGDYATTCIEDHECVFVYFDGGIARCAFEYACREGLTKWQKPLSCHLFPIRIRRLGADFVRYEQIEECAPARARGAAEHVALVRFLKEPLVRKYGQEWCDELLARCTVQETGKG